jgi:hypothetical protein
MKLVPLLGTSQKYLHLMNIWLVTHFKITMLLVLVTFYVLILFCLPQLHNFYLNLFTVTLPVLISFFISFAFCTVSVIAHLVVDAAY